MIVQLKILISSIGAGLFGRFIGTKGAGLLATSIGITALLSWATSIGITALLSWIIGYKVITENIIIYTGLIGRWIESGILSISMGIKIDSITTMMLILIITVSWLVHMYSTGYMSEDPHVPRFMTYLTTYYTFGATDYSTIFALASSAKYETTIIASNGMEVYNLTLIGILFLIGAINKSAQLELYTLLGVLALIIVLIIELSILFYVCYLASMIVGAIAAFNQSYIKRLLAYSAIAHIGYVLLALAVRSYTSIFSDLFNMISYIITSITIFTLFLSLTSSAFYARWYFIFIKLDAIGLKIFFH